MSHIQPVVFYSLPFHSCNIRDLTLNPFWHTLFMFLYYISFSRRNSSSRGNKVVKVVRQDHRLFQTEEHKQKKTSACHTWFYATGDRTRTHISVPQYLFKVGLLMEWIARCLWAEVLSTLLTLARSRGPQLECPTFSNFPSQIRNTYLQTKCFYPQ